MLQYLGDPLPPLQYTPLLSLLFQWVLNGVNDRVAASASVAVVTTPTTQVAMEEEWGAIAIAQKKESNRGGRAALERKERQ